MASNHKTSCNVSSDLALADSCQLMRSAGLPENVISNFSRLFNLVSKGISGEIVESEIGPVGQVDSLSEITADLSIRKLGLHNLNSLVIIRLNGGLGTTMGLDRAKSLIPVKGGLSFNDVIARQLEYLNYEYGCKLPLLHMTSFATDGDITEAMSSHNSLALPGIPGTFLQHKHPKLFEETLLPADDQNSDNNWNPPGHGDIYAALIASGVAEKLLAAGKRYAFVANADNLGATVDPTILGYLVKHSAPFLMETAVRTPADSKGGHLAQRRANGRLLLRETAQAPKNADGSIISEFSDISKYSHFNTNNIWLDLEAVMREAHSFGGFIPLPLITNRKTLNPLDRSSPPVLQLETAMGAAIEVFEGARALSVPRSRFAPVKGNSDLLLVLSDLYELDEKFNLRIVKGRENRPLPRITLDSSVIKVKSDFDTRFKVIPSLKNTDSLEIQGDVVFSHPVSIIGNVKVINKSGVQRIVPTEISAITDDDLVIT